jgi:hypothetical protein
MDRGALYFPANVFSITVKGGQRIEASAKERVPEDLFGAFQGKMAASGMKATFPLEALSPDSEVVVDYTGAGFAGMSVEDSKTRFRFEAKSLR